MSLVINSKCVDTKCREERRQREQNRRQADIRSGLIKINAGPQRGDFKICREGDKILKEYRNYKDPRAREKIKSDYAQMQKENRRS